jgi:predicted DNA-binding protein
MMQRTQISLGDEERRTLDAVAARTGKSISALIREAVSEVYGVQRSMEEDLADMHAAAGSWAERDETSVQYVDRMRSGSRWARLNTEEDAAQAPVGQ